MFKDIYQQLKPALLMMLILGIITGIIYPVMITIIAQSIFPDKANGSLITQSNKVIGSELIGQYFTEPKYFWGRPSATDLHPYNVLASSGSNLGPTNPKLITEINERIKFLENADPQNEEIIPIDLVTTSGSGIDPDISPLAAYYQVHRVAKARGLSEKAVQKIVLANISNRQFGILGEPRVNILKLNLALDQMKNKHE